ncbi:MAG TPA: hypothetical protein DCM87_18660 [Planctomycetes bacterium]|nr:hypothetical protein [Planctomycetota bacterium]
MDTLRAILPMLLVPALACASGGEAEASGVGFLTPLLPQVFWSVVTFALALFVLGRFAWPAIQKALDEREHRIREALDAAEKARKDAEEARERTRAEMAAEHRRMDEEAAAMRADIGRTREGLLAAARQEAGAVQRKALEAIEQAKLQALAEVRRRAADLAIAAAERIIARRLDADDERRFAQEAIDALRPPEAR